MANNLEYYRKRAGLTQEGLGKQVGTTKSQINRMEKGTRPFMDHWKHKIAPVLGVEPWQLAEGAPIPESEQTQHTPSLTKIKSNENKYSDSVSIPVYDVVVSAGHGSAVFEPRIIETWEMPRAFFKTLSATAGRNKAFLPVEGDSNAPDYNHGDYVLIDTSDTVPVNGRMYVVLDGDMLVLKEIELKPPHVFLVSRNPAYKPVKKRIDEVHIVAVVKKKVVDV